MTVHRHSTAASGLQRDRSHPAAAFPAGGSPLPTPALQTDEYASFLSLLLFFTSMTPSRLPFFLSSHGSVFLSQTISNFGVFGGFHSSDTFLLSVLSLSLSLVSLRACFFAPLPLRFFLLFPSKRDVVSQHSYVFELLFSRFLII